jgi:diguanylate cyclase (GGDEF)-like protein
MRREIAGARRGDRRFALHVIDLDGFRSVNDVMGHSTGDHFLAAVAERLRTIKRNGYVIARLGGDEFAVLQTNLSANEDAASLAEQIVAILHEPIPIERRNVALGASIGTAIHPADGDNIEDLLRHADLAMYKAKADGGDRHQFYAADMKRRACQAAELDAELRLAIEREPASKRRLGDATGCRRCAWASICRRSNSAGRDCRSLSRESSARPISMPASSSSS